MAFIAFWYVLYAPMWEIFTNNLAIFTNDVRVERVNGCWSDTRVPSRSFVSVPIGCGGCWPLSRAGLMSWVVGRTCCGKLGNWFNHRLPPARGGRGNIHIRCIVLSGGLRPTCFVPFLSLRWVLPWLPGGDLARGNTGRQDPPSLGWGLLTLPYWFGEGLGWCRHNGMAAWLIVFVDLGSSQ